MTIWVGRSIPRLGYGAALPCKNMRLKGMIYKVLRPI